MFKIDYTITYLDPTDPYWLEQFKPYYQDEMKKQPMRYDKDGIVHLKYHFRGIAKYMPWINNVYLIVFSESQVPDWINRDTVKIITDDMYIPRKFLPTFSTCTKQLYLHRIPGLEEHFIFADDDEFCINPISSSSFFDSDGNPRPDNVEKEKVWKIKNNGNMWRSILYNSVKFAHDITQQVYTINPIVSETFLHMPQSVLKSDLEYYHSKYSEQIESTITPCRCKDNITGVAWCVANSIKYKNKTDIKVKQIGWWNKSEEHNIFWAKNSGIHIMNINENDKGKYYQIQLEQLFPEKCKYEK